jgi:hypothetical protein
VRANARALTSTAQTCTQPHVRAECAGRQPRAAELVGGAVGGRLGHGRAVGAWAARPAASAAQGGGDTVASAQADRQAHRLGRWRGRAAQAYVSCMRGVVLRRVASHGASCARRVADARRLVVVVARGAQAAGVHQAVPAHGGAEARRQAGGAFWCFARARLRLRER